MADLESRSRLSPITWVALILTVVGALNWGMVGLFDFDLVAAIFGDMTALSRIVYVLVAAAGVYLLVDGATRLNEVRGRHGPGIPAAR